MGGWEEALIPGLLRFVADANDTSGVYLYNLLGSLN